LVITNSTFEANHVDDREGSGSVIWIKEWAADVTTAVSIEGSTFDGNEAGAGSVIHDIAGSNISVENSTFSNNIGQFGPAGILTDGSLALLNSTFSGNVGDCTGFPNGACGIAIHIPSGSISFSTIVENQGPSSGAAVFAEGAGIKVNGSIIANNIGGDCGTSGGGSIGSSPASLDSDGSCQAPITADPLVDPLADNGGPTYTHALQVGSPALEAGLVSCPPNDQRGVSRPYPTNGECDLGAYESSDVFPVAQPEIPPDLVATSMPTPTPTSKSLEWAGIPKKDILCYRGPDPGFEVVSALKANQEISLVGISEKGTYAVADNPIYPGVNCWVRIDHLTVANEVKVLLPTITDPAFPTKTPTPTEKPAPPTATTKPGGTISGVVWKDNNGDGERQKGESDGIGGLTVYLGQGACSSSGYRQSTTGGSGKFTFSSLPAGTYCLSVNVTPTCGGYTVATTATAYTINLSAGGSEFKRFGFTPLVCY
jgi:hypothetical protein